MKIPAKESRVHHVETIVDTLLVDLCIANMVSVICDKNVGRSGLIFFSVVLRNNKNNCAVDICAYISKVVPRIVGVPRAKGPLGFYDKPRSISMLNKGVVFADLVQRVSFSRK